WSAAVPTYVLPNLRAALARESTENPTSGATLSSLAYVLYTSGTTERKGVQVTHRGLGRLARAQIDGFGVVPEDRFSQFLLPSFDAFLSELVTASLSGDALY